MGFGMRKEVYKRKPKKLFRRFKKIYGNDIPKREKNLDAPEFTSDEILNKPRFKSIHDFKIFRVIRVIILLSLIGAFVNSIWLQPWLEKRRLAKYQGYLVESFSTSHNAAFKFSKQLCSSLAYFNFDSNQYSLVAKSNGFTVRKYPKYLTGPGVVKFGSWDANANSFKIENDNLFQSTDSGELIHKYWILVFESDSLDQEYVDVMGALSVDIKLISQIRDNLLRTKIKEILHLDSITHLTIEDTTRFGAYEYIQVLDTSNLKRLGNTIKISDGIYLHKKY